MSALLNKSNENYTAMQMLSEKKLYASATHCAYYRCLQFMKHILLEEVDQEYTNDYISEKKRNNDNSHVLIFSHLKIAMGSDWPHNHDTLITDIKKLRTKADYDPYPCVKGDFENAAGYSDEIVEPIKAKYEL